MMELHTGHLITVPFHYRITSYGGGYKNIGLNASAGRNKEN